MTQTKAANRFLPAIIFSMLCTCFALAQNTPIVSKVEPPNWWVGNSINPVRVLVRGQNLGGAKVEASGDGLSTGLIRVNARGTYLFADLKIEPTEKPARRTPKRSTPGRP